jgi:hypothetical protein
LLLPAVLALAGAGGSSPRTARLADLDSARTQYILTSRAFTPESRQQALEAARLLELQAGTLSRVEFLVGIAHLAALARNAHDAFDFGEGAWRPPRRLPFRMMWFPDGMVVSRGPPQYGDLLGARVETIDGRTPDDVFAKLGAIDGGTFAYRTWNSEWAVEHGAVMHALGLTASADRMRFGFIMPGGARATRDIELVPRSDVPTGVDAPRLWAPEPFAGERESGWRAANAGVPVPLYLQEPDRLFRIAGLPQNTLYLQLRSNHDEDDQKIAPFVQRAMQRLSSRPRITIVDLRFDTGGNNELTIDLMRSIPKMTAGTVYLLVGRYTFSAGIASAAALKHAGGTRVKIVGEEVGDRLRWWSEGKPACLPNTHYCLHPTTGLWDLRRGCAREPYCYGDQYDSTVGSLAPDIAAPLTAASWLKGEDPAMSAVERDISDP